MHNIEVKILNPEAVTVAEKMMVCAARLTQRGHKIQNMADFMELYEQPYKAETAAAMSHLPHPTIQKFSCINVVVVGASRRFLAQVTRHQNEVKFMSASLQYSDYSGAGAVAVPYGVLERGDEEVEKYLATCRQTMDNYDAAIEQGLDNDSAGYMMPHGLRNVLIISATPYQWKHMIGQRICRRNTDETRIVFLSIWQELYDLCPALFAPDTTGPFCCREHCREGKMSCGKPMDKTLSPIQMLLEDYPLLFQEEEDAGNEG